MPLDDYLVGVAYLIVTAGSVVAAAALVVLRRLPHLRGAAGLLAFAVLGTAGLLVVHLLPGLAGVLSRVSALVCAWPRSAWRCWPHAVTRADRCTSRLGRAR